MFKNQENVSTGDKKLLCLEKLAWLHPLDVAAQIPAKATDWILLYSGMKTGYTGQYSYLALNKLEEVSDTFAALEKKLHHSEHSKGSNSNKQTDPSPLAQDDSVFSNAWFGYLGYGLKNQLESLSNDAPTSITAQDLWFARFGIIIVFDHKAQKIEVWGEGKGEGKMEKREGYLGVYDILKNTKNGNKVSSFPLPPSHCSLTSNMTRAEYLEKVNYIKECIKRGDLYQANLTRKFFGELDKKTKAFDIFRKLCEISPAPYSAFIKTGDLHVISSSPERFLHVDKNGNANTRPIKGSAARKTNVDEDKTAIANLKNSEKDRAENLMIVDLSRNDLSRNCDAGSIKVDELFNIETYATVHHMVSSVSGKKKKGTSTLDLIKGCFPPGSMTGTPKIKAIETCSQLEKLQRGIYSGAIGWFGGDGSADFSVVIRTIVMQGNKFEFQVGGAIVNDSEAESEFTETMTKAKGVAGALGIDIESLEQL